MEVKKSDWKKYREKIGEWQENYMDRLLKEYISLLQQEDQDPSERFWNLEERIKNDKKHPGVRIELSKRDMIFDLVRLIRMNVITFDDLSDFSLELQEDVRMMHERMSNW